MFSKYDVYTTVQSMYCYPDTDVLINKLGIHDKTKLKQAEEEFTAVKQMALLQEPIKGRFTKTHLFRIHRFLFEDVYPFAGHIRKEQISKGDTMFYPPDLIDRELERVFKNIRSKKLLAERNEEKQIQNLSQTMAELNIIHTVKEVRPRYSCFYKIRHPGDCDGQSGYGVSKLDSIVEEVVRQIFAQFREVSRKKLLESVKTNDAARIQKKVKKIQKDLESKQKELDDLKAETILVIRGVSALDKELLGTLVAEARETLETLEKQLVQAQEEYEEATKTAKRSNYICNELFTWADVYDTANHDERRAILQQFIKEIRVRKDYEISITLNASFNQVEQLKAVSTYDGAEIFEEISEKGA